MLNYIKSESYRALHNKGYLIFFGICIVLAALVNFLAAGNAPFNQVSFSMTVVVNLFSFITMLTLCVSDMVFGEEYKNQTMKNVLAFGYTRTQLYFGKFITEIIFALGIATAAFGLFTASAFLLLETSPESAPMIRSFFLLLLGCIPVWLGGLALAHMVLFLFRSNNVSVFVFVALYYLPGSALAILSLWKPAFSHIIPYLLSSQTDPMIQLFIRGALEPGDLLSPALISLIHIAVFLTLGLALYKRKEL